MGHETFCNRPKRNLYFRYICSLLALLADLPAYAQNSVAISDDVDQHIFTYTELSYLEDSENKFEIDQVATRLQASFVPNKLFSPHNFNPESAYWIRLVLKGNPSSEKKWILEFFDQTIDHIEAYLPSPDHSFHKVIMGDARPFGERKFRHKNFEIELSNDSDLAQAYYFRVKADHSVNIIITLRSVNHFIYYALNEYLIFGVFYGMILVVAIYNLLMYFVIRERQYIVYILYALSVGFYTLCTDGIGFQYLWPDHPEWNATMYGVALYFTILCALLFTKLFLHTKSRHPVLHRLLTAFIVIRTIIFFTGLAFYPRIFEYRWIEFFPLSLAFFAGLYSYLKGYRPARFFALAYALLFAGFCIKVLINLDIAWIPGSIITNYSISISFWFEMWLLSFALADKVRIIKDSKDRALRRIIRQQHDLHLLKDKVNRELENEVAKRTKEIDHQKQIIEVQFQELQQVNMTLKQQSDEITKMNQLLDLDNYKLKRNIQESLLARAASKNMTYEEFREIFPDDLTCLRYLEQQKWQNGFVCKKCDYEKCRAGKGKFDRRCTKCGYNESPTAFTIFHGIKFPIAKAFYILHLVMTERDDITLDETSELLKLRRNTCWHFKDKVNKIVKKEARTRGQIVHWESLIFTPEEVA
jgi:two-component system, sensor histidine kinase LadS